MGQENKISRSGWSASPARTDARANSKPSGAQALERALRILREIASSGALGLRLIDLQHRTGFAKPTAHRIVRTLVRHNFVTYDDSCRRYFLGAEISILSVSAPTDLPDLQDLSRQELRALAQDTGDTAYLMVRSGNDIVCVAREIGPYPIKALTGEIGVRRPLGVGAGGVILLASLPAEEADAILKSNRHRMRAFPNASERAIRGAVKKARDVGYAFSGGLVIRAVRGIGIAVHDKRGQAVAALSVAAIRERMTRRHVEDVIAALHRARRAIEHKLRAQPKVRLRFASPSSQP